MTKTFLAALAAFPMIAGASELARGTVEVTGTSLVSLSAGSSTSRSDGGSTSADHLDLGGDAGALYYVVPNLGLGVHAGYGYSRTKLTGITTSSSEVRVGPVVSYQLALAPQLAFFQRLSGSWIHGSSSSSGSNLGDLGISGADTTTRGYGFGVAAGIKYFPARMVSLDAGLGWSWSHLEWGGAYVPTVTSKGSTLGLDLGLSVYFGGGR